MGEVIRFKKPTAAEKAKGKTLCRQGLHKWAINKASAFDSRQGRLVTQYRCSRCGAVRIRAH